MACGCDWTAVREGFAGIRLLYETDWAVSGWDAAAGWESVLAIGPCHGFARVDGWMDG